MGAMLGVNLDLPASESTYKTKLNYGYEGAVYVKHNISQKLNSEVGLKGSYLIEDTTIADQSQTDIGIYFKLNYIFGDQSNK